MGDSIVSELEIAAGASTTIAQAGTAEPHQLTRRVLNCARVRLLIVAASVSVFFLFLVTAHSIIASFARIFASMLAGEPLPGLTHFVIGMADLFGTFVLPWWPFLLVFGVGFVVTLLISPTLIGRELLLRFTFVSRQVIERMAMAAAAHDLAVRIRRGETVPDALAEAAKGCLLPRLALRLREWGESLRIGEEPPNFQRNMDRALMPLREIITDADRPRRNVNRLEAFRDAQWEPRDLTSSPAISIVLFCVMVFATGAIALGLVLPNIKLIEQLGG